MVRSLSIRRSFEGELGKLQFTSSVHPDYKSIKICKPFIDARNSNATGKCGMRKLPQERYLPDFESIGREKFLHEKGCLCRTLLATSAVGSSSGQDILQALSHS